MGACPHFVRDDFYPYDSPCSETNLKIKQASPHTSSLTSPQLVQSLIGNLRCEQPNNSLYTFEGTLDLRMPSGVPKQVSTICPYLEAALYCYLFLSSWLRWRSDRSDSCIQVPLGPDQILLRGAQLRNTPWCYGLVVFTGHETKLMR